jgi:hypothetical protein
MSDDFMKSALDRAMERADRIQIPEEKLKEMEYRSEGERIAARFFKEPDCDLEAVLGDCDLNARQYILKALESILLQNLVLPRKESDITGNEKAFKGLSAIKKDKSAIQQAREQLENLSNYYTQARKQHYDQLKAQFEAMQQQTGVSAAGNLHAEQTPEFQENWRQLSASLDAEYDKALDQLKQQIASIR